MTALRPMLFRCSAFYLQRIIQTSHTLSYFNHETMKKIPVCAPLSLLSAWLWWQECPLKLLLYIRDERASKGRGKIAASFMGVFKREAEKSGQREGGVETNAWRVVTTVMQRTVKTARKTMNGERKNGR